MLLAIVGGALIGLSASLYWSLNGRIAGVSGIVCGALLDLPRDRSVRLVFVLGLVLAGVVFAMFTHRIVSPTLPLAPLAGAGLLVGFGTRLGGGCTSGHGVCGISRFSVRSLVALLTFISVGMLTVFIARHGLAHWQKP